MNMIKPCVIYIFCIIMLSCKTSDIVLYEGTNYQIKWFLDEEYFEGIITSFTQEEIHLNSTMVDSTMPNPFSPMPWLFIEVQPEDSVNIIFRDSINWKGGAVVSNINRNGVIIIKHKDVINSLKATSTVIDYIRITFDRNSSKVTEVSRGTLNVRGHRDQ